jgi:glycerol dehydrogenase-like iron-containing ADH family enzyme
MHGLKVAIGTLVSIELYRYIKDRQLEFDGAQEVYALVDELPCVETLREMLVKMGCPIRFSALGVRKETMEEMLEKAYTVRDRYTILTFINEHGLTKEITPLIMSKYY